MSNDFATLAEVVCTCGNEFTGRLCQSGKLYTYDSNCTGMHYISTLLTYLHAFTDSVFLCVVKQIA